MASNYSSNLINIDDYSHNTTLIKSNSKKKVSKQKEKDKSSVLTGFICGGHKCTVKHVWVANGFHAAKTLALEEGWTFGTKKYLCPKCSLIKLRIARRIYSPSCTLNDSTLYPNIFKS